SQGEGNGKTQQQEHDQVEEHDRCEIVDEKFHAQRSCAGCSRSACRWARMSSTRASSSLLPLETCIGLGHRPCRKPTHLTRCDSPARISKAKPTGIRSFAGQRIRPSVFEDSSWVIQDSQKNGIDSQNTRQAAGNRKNSTPKISIPTCARSGSFCDRTSTRTCSLRRKV